MQPRWHEYELETTIKLKKNYTTFMKEIHYSVSSCALICSQTVEALFCLILIRSVYLGCGPKQLSIIALLEPTF